MSSLYCFESETWRMTEKTVSKLQTFNNRCLRRVLGIYWRATISNASLWETTGQAPVRHEELTSRKCTWIGHPLRRPNYCISRQALLWNPQGSRRRGRTRKRGGGGGGQTDHIVGRSFLASAGTPVQGQRGLEGLCQYLAYVPRWNN